MVPYSVILLGDNSIILVARDDTNSRSWLTKITVPSNLLNAKLDNAYKYVKDKYSEEEIVKSTIDVYSNLLDKKSTSYLNKKNENESFWIAQ